MKRENSVPIRRVNSFF